MKEVMSPPDNGGFAGPDNGVTTAIVAAPRGASVSGYASAPVA